MGIIATCPNGHRIKVKDELAGRRGICPTCASRFRIPVKDALRGSDSDAGDSGWPTARIVSLDPVVASSLPVAFAIDEAEVAVTTDEAAEAVPDFIPIADEPVAAAPALDRPVAAGPIDERPDLAWCVAVRGGAPSAPLDAEALRAWLESGSASAEHVVWRADWPDWRPLAEVFPEALPPERRGWP